MFWWQAACAVPGPHIFQPWQSVQLCLLGVPPKRVREVKLLTDIDEVHDLGLPDYAVKNLVDAYLVTGRRTQGRSARDERKGWEKRHGALPGRSTGAIKNNLTTAKRTSAAGRRRGSRKSRWRCGQFAPTVVQCVQVVQ